MKKAAFHENQAAAAKCRMGSSHNGNFSEGPLHIVFFLPFKRSKGVQAWVREQKTKKKHPSSCGFLMDHLAPVQDRTLLMKN